MDSDGGRALGAGSSEPQGAGPRDAVGSGRKDNVGVGEDGLIGGCPAYQQVVQWGAVVANRERHIKGCGQHCCLGPDAGNGRRCVSAGHSDDAGDRVRDRSTVGCGETHGDAASGIESVGGGQAICRAFGAESPCRVGDRPGGARCGALEIDCRASAHGDVPAGLDHVDIGFTSLFEGGSEPQHIHLGLEAGGKCDCCAREEIQASDLLDSGYRGDIFPDVRNGERDGRGRRVASDLVRRQHREGLRVSRSGLVDDDLVEAIGNGDVLSGKRCGCRAEGWARIDPDPPEFIGQTWNPGSRVGSSNGLLKLVPEVVVQVCDLGSDVGHPAGVVSGLLAVAVADVRLHDIVAPSPSASRVVAIGYARQRETRVLGKGIVVDKGNG